MFDLHLIVDIAGYMAIGYVFGTLIGKAAAYIYLGVIAARNA